jgi:hypothetical protein
MEDNLGNRPVLRQLKWRHGEKNLSTGKICRKRHPCFAIARQSGRSSQREIFKTFAYEDDAM